MSRSLALPLQVHVSDGAVRDRRRDGCGRFWVSDGGGRQPAVWPTRYAYQEATETALPAITLLPLHGCEVPLCVHVDPDPLRAHVMPGTHRQNLLDRSSKGRHVNGWTVV